MKTKKRMCEAMKNEEIIGLVTITSVIAAVVGAYLAQTLIPLVIAREYLYARDINLSLLMIKTSVSFVNIVLIIVLLLIYVNLYRTVRSRFTLGLILVILVLFLYALTSNPILQALFGSEASSLGLFAIIPDLFTTFALLVFFYLSLE